MPRQNNIQFRRGSYSQWDSQSTGILANGEPGFVSDFNKLKIGDGITEWSDLNAVNDALTTLVFNDTGSTISGMSVVYINGAQGDLPKITLSIASGEMTSSKSYGIVVSDISTGSVGEVVVDGALKGLNTLSKFSGVTPGAALWLSPTVSGGITTTKSYAPNHSVFVGNLIRVHQNQGVINVRIINGFELDELHNVAVTGATNGQFLKYDSGSGLWVPSSSGSFDYLSSTSGDVTNLVVGSISGSDPLTISTPTASMVINDYTIFLQSDVKAGANLQLAESSTADSLLVTDGNKNVVSLISPSLTEIGYVSGVTSSIQSQLNGKQATLTNPVTGTGVVNHIPYWGSTSGLLADSNQLVWDSTNNRLGISTSSPSYSLDVSGTIGVSGIARFNNDIYMLDNTKRISWDNGTEYIGRQGDSIIIGTQSTTRILVSSTGGVGIGTESPGATLDVRGSAIFNEAGVDADFRIEGDTDANLVFVDASTDRVGIGTSTPSDKLNIVGNISAGTLSNTQGKFIAYGSASQPNLLFEGFGTDGTARISTNSGANRQLKIENDGASNTLGVYIEGDVGIGTTTPGYKLQVAGSFGATTKSFRIDHPSKKGYSLEYGSLESPYHGVRLTGRGKVIKGIGTVDLPDYLKDLIHDDESIVIQLTNYKHGKTLYVSNIDLQNDKFIVKADRAKSFGELEFFWTLTGVRKDVEDLVVEKEN